MSHGDTGLLARLLVCMVSWIVGWEGGTSRSHAAADCVVETAAGSGEAGLVQRLAPTCSQSEREARAVQATAVLDALMKERRVELVGVIVQGDLDLDRLPVQEAGSSERMVPEKPDEAKGQGVRRIRTTLIIRDSVVRGAVRHGLSGEGRLFAQPIDLRGTAFEGEVDFSRSIFQEAVQLSGATFQKEAYFVQGSFMKGLDCRETKFGPRTRFHRSVFWGPVDCSGALFDGMAEFLEVTFEQSAVFERARFGSGTGFSGSRFVREANFEEAIFSRDAFFAFSVFEENVVFFGTRFLGRADFSGAVFRKPDDLAKARFNVPPLFTNARRVSEESPGPGSGPSFGPYVVTAACLVLAVALLVYAWKI